MFATRYLAPLEVSCHPHRAPSFDIRKDNSSAIYLMKISAYIRYNTVVLWYTQKGAYL